MRSEKEHISDWARSHSMAAGSFASQDDRWQNTNTKRERESHDQVMRAPATIRKLLNVLFFYINFLWHKCFFLISCTKEKIMGTLIFFFLNWSCSLVIP